MISFADLPDDFELSKAFFLRQWGQYALQEKLVLTFKRTMSGPESDKNVRAPSLRQVVAGWLFYLVALSMSDCGRQNNLQIKRDRSHCEVFGIQFCKPVRIAHINILDLGPSGNPAELV